MTKEMTVNSIFTGISYPLENERQETCNPQDKNGKVATEKMEVERGLTTGS